MLYLRAELLSKATSKEATPASAPKAKAGASKPADTSAGRGERRGGQYAARIQDGYEKDGSPKYKYFKTEEEYEKYIAGRGKSKSAKQLEDKVKKEHAESTDKHTGRVVHQPASKKHGLLASDKPINKSARLYVRSF